MRAALLVAAREFRQVVSTRGFWVTLLVVPLAITVLVVQNGQGIAVVKAAGHAPPPLRG